MAQTIESIVKELPTITESNFKIFIKFTNLIIEREILLKGIDEHGDSNSVEELEDVDENSLVYICSSNLLKKLEDEIVKVAVELNPNLFLYR